MVLPQAENLRNFNYKDQSAFSEEEEKGLHTIGAVYAQIRNHELVNRYDPTYEFRKKIFIPDKIFFSDKELVMNQLPNLQEAITKWLVKLESIQKNRKKKLQKRIEKIFVFF